jgi:N-acetylglucosamine repressor
LRTGHRELIRDLNRTLVLNLVREHGGLSRAAIARISGLSPSTVTGITSSLLEDGYLLEDVAGSTGTGSNAIGRPATTLRIDPTAGHVVGIKVTADELVASVVDLAATPLGGTVVPRGRESDPAGIGAMFEQAVRGALEHAGVPRDRLLGVGIGVPGIVDPGTGRVADSPLLEWAHLDLVRFLEERLGLPVLVDNDVNTLTIAEQLFGAARGLANVIVVTIGRGIGMGLIINGIVFRGTRGGAGEIGHVQAAAGGPDCWCGRRGCLEAVAAEPAVIREVLAVTSHLLKPTEVAARAARDEKVADILDRAGRHVGRAIAAMSTVLDPQRIVISGEGVRLGDRYLDAIRTELATSEHKEVPTEVVIEPWGDEQWARGAATLVLRELFHPAHLRDEATPLQTSSDSGHAPTPSAARAGRGGPR